VGFVDPVVKPFVAGNGQIGVVFVVQVSSIDPTSKGDGSSIGGDRCGWPEDSTAADRPMMVDAGPERRQSLVSAEGRFPLIWPKMAKSQMTAEGRFSPGFGQRWPKVLRLGPAASAFRRPHYAVRNGLLAITDIKASASNRREFGSGTAAPTGVSGGPLPNCRCHARKSAPSESPSASASLSLFTRKSPCRWLRHDAVGMIAG
jgi:hypothetical protein